MKQGGHQAQFQNVLKNAKMGEVVTRFPPEPSGYLHIGHIKACILNYHYSKLYNGKMLVRFDDTNPSKENAEFEGSILKDMKTLGLEWAALSYSSDYFDLAQDKCRQLLSEGLAYCDNTEVNQMRANRAQGIESASRAQTPEQNLELFEKMLSGEAPDYCVRAKIDMKALNKCMRDPVLYRCNDVPHHRTGTKYKAYPTYDFMCPILDSHEGVTHALRTNEYSDRIPQYFWMQEALKIRKNEIYEFSRLNFVNTCLSKRMLQKFVDKGIVENWEDPRFPTLRGITRRGITIECLKDFMIEQGPSKNANLQSWDKLWAINFQKIDPISPRYTAIGMEGMAVLNIPNFAGEEVVQVPAHPKNNELGQRDLYRGKAVYIEAQDAKEINNGDKITLMRWGNVQITHKEEKDGQIVLTGEDLPDDKDFKTTKKYTWLAKNSPIVNVELVEYDHLIRVKTIEENMNFEDFYNPQSKFVTPALADAGIKKLALGAHLQFERRGFFIIDKIENDRIVLNYIPDGKAKAASIQTKLDQGQVVQGKQEVQSTKKAKKQKQQQQQQQQEQPKQEQPKQE